jgi:rSAM/selenodomain-associated transferase 2
MAEAIRTAFDRNAQAVLLVGTDVPELRKYHVEAAFEALTTCDLVLGPSIDGGYWLVGCCRPLDIFSNIQWSTATVLEQTLAAARRSKLTIRLLEPLNDIDTEDDLNRWQPHRPWRRPYLSIIIPTVNEARWIEQTVSRVRSPDTEILVADGGSRDRTRALARQAGATVLPTARGRALQQNQAASLAQGLVLLFLHADTRLPADFGTHIFEMLMDPDRVAGAFRFKTDLEHWAMRVVEQCAHIRAKLFHLPYGDQALFMRKKTFDQIGGFPQAPVAEDLLLVRNLAKMGAIGIAPAAAVTSGRRWRNKGIWRTTAINYLIAGGILLGLSPGRLAFLYRREAGIGES